VPYLPAGVFRGSIERALAEGLGRPVAVGNVRFTFFPGPIPGPGFSLERVTIQEDPRAGIEPFAYIDEAGASLSLLSLVRGELGLASLNLGAATVNLVKTPSGPWNFEYLLERVRAQEAAMPSIRVRGGRVNFKFGDTKSVFYFSDADLDIEHLAGDALEMRVGGALSRTDRSAQDFGRFFLNGTALAGGELDLQVELERSSLGETLRLFDPLGFGVHGAVALEARIRGMARQLNIQGTMELGDIHRWDLLPSEGGGWRLAFGGQLDLPGERLELETAPAIASGSEPPVVVRFASQDFLRSPKWEAGADFREVPLNTLFEVGRHMGVPLPENVVVDGSVSGSAVFNQDAGLSGRLTLTEASLTLPEGEPLRAPEATVAIGGGEVRLEPSVVHIGESQSAEIRGSYTLAVPRALDLRISTGGLSVAAMRSFGLSAIPVIGQTPRGTWTGWARYRNLDSRGVERDTWTGESELRNAVMRLDGLAAPIEIESAAVSLSGAGLAVNRIQALAGGLPFSGSYRWEPAEARPHKFSVVFGALDGAALERLFEPALLRERGFLARTLRLGSAPPAPAWLRQRKADGVIAAESFTAGGWTVRALKARVLWDGTQVRFANLGGLLDPAAFSGELTVDLAAPTPQYHFDGELTGIPYAGGRVDAMGTIDVSGPASEWIARARAAGSIRGRAIAFAPEAEFRTVLACFQIEPAGSGPRWRLYDVEATQADQTLAGTGVSQSGERLVLDLKQDSAEVRYTGTLIAASSGSAAVTGPR
jgi:hypothetical protein